MKAKSTERQERLAQALRENLKRRKARERSLAREAKPEPPDRPNNAQKPD
jgi:hypothetical protein